MALPQSARGNRVSRDSRAPIPSRPVRAQRSASAPNTTQAPSERPIGPSAEVPVCIAKARSPSATASTKTGTSPQVYILGNLGSYDGRCVVSGTRLVCSLGTINKAATKRRQSSTAGARLDAAEDKVQSLSDQLIDLQGDLENEVTEIDVRWANLAKQIETVQVPLEKNDVKVTQLVLGWLPVS